MSAAEQGSAGLERLAPDTRLRLGELDAAYKARFGFPFILAVRGCTAADILANLTCTWRTTAMPSSRRCGRSSASPRSVFRIACRPPAEGVCARRREGPGLLPEGPTCS
jgi:hypothetical protein